MLPSRGDFVDGLLLEAVDPASLRALDAYEDEGRLYRREQATVVVGDRQIACHIYVAA